MFGICPSIPLQENVWINFGFQSSLVAEQQSQSVPFNPWYKQAHKSKRVKLSSETDQYFEWNPQRRVFLHIAPKPQFKRPISYFLFMIESLYFIQMSHCVNSLIGVHEEMCTCFSFTHSLHGSVHHWDCQTQVAFRNVGFVPVCTYFWNIWHFASTFCILS